MNRIGHFEPLPTLAVAVSGGPDSMALLLLSHEWAKARGGRVVALTVDHGLRPESAQEAARVADWCKALGIAHHTLKWEGEKPAASIQETARQARYALLTAWCRQQHVLHLLTAHHRDDVAETLVFRLARGSGMDGLSGLAGSRVEGGVRLLRPMLGYSKRELIEFLEAKKQPWLHDASNDKPIYTRNLIRLQIGSEPALARAAQIATAFGKLRKKLEKRAAHALAEAVFIYPQGYVFIEHKALAAMPPELALRALSAVLQTVSGETKPPRTEKLIRLLKNMQNPQPAKQTLHGCVLIFQKKNNGWLVAREPAAMAAQVTLTPGEWALWDGRFAVRSTQAESKHPVKIRAILPAELHIIDANWRKNFMKALPKPALYSLPAFWVLEELLAVPHIGYNRSGLPPENFEARFRPAKALAGATFCGMTDSDT